MSVNHYHAIWTTAPAKPDLVQSVILKDLLKDPFYVNLR